MVVLLVLMTLILALTLDHVVQKLGFARHRSAQATAAADVARDTLAEAPLAEAPLATTPLATAPLATAPLATTLRSAVAGPPMPGFLDPSHCWIELRPTGLAAVGVDALVTALLGPPDRVTMRPTGAFVIRGEPLLTLHRGTRQLTLRAPVSGLVAEHNLALQAAPAALADQPYGAHWLCLLQPQELGTALRAMTIAEEATRWLRGELRRAREALLALHQPATAKLGLTAADGGLPEAGLSTLLADDEWRALAGEVFGAEAPIGGPPTT
ncbi:MAG: hypothetical protein IPL40_10385 [Proteobacteria bacterium]|nr:hypothetical protein [Pseudomonadota bacterium]